ncbi:hypothetical protein RRG08_004034 [Elysia crispata]|uniref:Uncharacterized protein n=1 Tax=Elysia crispata TaxID=231223 RepID=A0AAE1ALD6_9GAST|nr:hypothetical protein RRG08_004034 [Elysia crispata]
MDGTWPGMLFLSAVLLTTVTGFTIDDETRLRSDKLTNYTLTVRPRSQTIVQLAFHMTAISGVDLKNQIFSVAGWWSMIWTDPRLAWTESDYDNIPVIQIFENLIWTPSVVVDNSVNDLSAIDEDNIPLRVDSAGAVTWNPPGLLSVSCKMDITRFPFDTQVCSLQVTSFGYTIDELDIYVFGPGISLSFYSEDGEWTILSTWHERDTFIEGAYEYSRVYFYFKLERKPLFYGLNMLLPVLVMALLTVFVFVLPADSGEKIGYCLTVLLAFMVILTIIAEDLPTTATNTSILELYIAIVLIMDALSVVLSICVLDIYHRPEDTPIPRFVRKLTVLGMRINGYQTSPLCCKRKVEPGMDYRMFFTEHNMPREQAQRMGSPHVSAHYIRDTLASENLNQSQIKTKTDRVTSENRPKAASLQRPEMTRNYTSLNLRPVTAKSTLKDMSRGGEITWQTVSIVLDGFLLRFYTVFLTISSIVLMALLVAG